MASLTSQQFIKAGARDTSTAGPLTAARIRSLYEIGAKDLLKARRDAWINRSFIAGEQMVYWQKEQQRLAALPKSQENRLRVVMNRLRPSQRIILAKLLSRQLTFEVPPSGADDASEQGAQLAETVLMDYAREQNWESDREDAVQAAFETGTGLLCIEWNPRAGAHVTEDDNGEPVGEGDICLHALAITDVATEPGVHDIERARYWIRAAALPPDEVKDLYGLPTRPAADASATMSPLHQQIANPSNSETPQDLTLVLHYYERPTNSSKGQVAVVVGDQIVGGGPKPWPFPFKDRLNVVTLRETREAGKWYGSTVLSDAISPQQALNQAWSSLIEHTKLAGTARMMVPIGSVDDPSKMSDEPGEVVTYVPIGNAAPSFLSPPNLPGWMREQTEKLKAEIDDILGVHDVSRGDAPSGVESGVAIRLLADADDTPLGRLSKEMADAFGRIASMALEILAVKVKETRKARVERVGGLPDEVEWDGAELVGQTRALVPPDAVAPRSRAASFQIATQLWREGVIKDEKQFYRIAEFPGAQDITETLDLDQSKARRENRRMAIGRPVPPDDFDDHAKHIAEHNNFRKSSRYEQSDDEIKELFELHIQAHATLAAEEAGAQTAKTMVSPALAMAAQAGEPPMAGDPAAMAPMPLPQQQEAIPQEPPMLPPEPDLPQGG